ncbi:MAG: SAM-dependent methyltransferase [Candidatus Dactylopiibacterium carminicum]|uniref:SAM-dependent methyltransferase n=1 Tax=Candidatus Dactylopiibacterium carminicum TaxID=857335 RepID=A0A272EUS0_9RHOO|nr:RsmB/NOP family class I SAM-dependent RNA methyltransferase [Candidatus Dactylopiibacterium carminicum]KAF7600327.1 SAM-dependent methyltransferase [Candidatus Dactylopiibacterium carminicum]PAS93339.1 MAG: SAM-dependent methyltransferase [Candidatus Dactylopiibacterium carminicum]PAS93845.1 MAG: SAM-dependent methyltransferase [Candidatus Dactylopiibacterium carminicum]PAT00330.1 MAG: SAM-dependent methyltransferase [Candidatus Dactylopiibacterium carminicum]
MTTNITSAQLDAAADLLDEVLRFQFPADSVVSGFFRKNRNAGARDRAFIAEAVYGVLRNLRQLRAVVGESTRARKLVLAWLLRVEGLSQRQLAPLLSRGEAEWVGELKASSYQPVSLGERTNLPDWLAERLLAQSDETRVMALASALNRPALLDLRVNPLKIERDAALERLLANGITAQPTPYSPLGIRVDARTALQRHPLFTDGSIEVQDEGSQLLGLLLAPRRSEMVADFCAGAGGKTLLLGALMRSTGRLYAFDVSEKRLQKAKPRLARAGLSNVHPVTIDHENDARIKRLAGKMDRVLVDAPCSGFGTLRRNPDLKWRQTEAALAALTQKQASILAAAARLVKPGGRLVYATCSLLREENDGIVDAFLAAQPQFRPVAAEEILKQAGVALETGERLHLDPLRHNTDGFFAAAFERTA